MSYFDQVPDWGAFVILNDDINGRIPVTKVSHWRDLFQIFEDEFFNRPGTQFVFRGHRRYDWNLTPSLGRFDERGIISKKVADNQYEKFSKAVRGRLKDTTLVNVGEEDELWAVGQHHGLMTPLLDWTYSPYVGLFFAFENEDKLKQETENSYRVLYVLNKTFLADEELRPDIRIVEPRKDEHGRLVNQAGLFTFSPYENTIENELIDALQSENGPLVDIEQSDEAQELARYICKIYIKNEDRRGCLKNLQRMNVHHASLFPDLVGASKYSNGLIEEESRYQIIVSDEVAVTEEVAEQEITEEHIAIAQRAVRPIDEAERMRIEDFLSKPEGSVQVEKGRIQSIAQEILQEIKKYTIIVDWRSREPVQAKLRNVIRSVLRKYGYPQSIREQIVEEILQYEIEGEEPKV